MKMIQSLFQTAALLGLLVVSFPLSLHSQTCATPTAGMVGWWTGDGNAFDTSRGNNGTLLRDASYTTGKVGQGFLLDGSSDAVTVGNPSSLELQNFTIEAWLKRNDLERASQTEGGGYVFGYELDGYGFGIKDDGALYLSKVGRNEVVSSARISDTNFHHVAVTKNGSAVVFYVDGESRSTASYGETFFFTSPGAIGGWTSGQYSSLIGIIDEVAIYDRALLGSEIQSIYQAQSAGRCKSNPPVIVTQPVSRTAYEGRKVNFSIGAGGSAPLSYQWRFSGTNILNATNSALQLPSVAMTNAGVYDVVVLNAFGTVTSSNVTLSVLPAPSCAPLDSLVGWWSGDDETFDLAQNNHGTLLGNASYTSGQVGRAFHFDGSQDAVTVGKPAALKLQDFTIEAWLKRDSDSRASQTSGGGYVFGYEENGYGFGIKDDGRLYLSKVGQSETVSSARVSDTNFHHVAVTKNGRRVVFYVDGVPGSTNDYAETFSFASPAAIGGWTSGRYSSLIGVLDEVAVYNRALTEDEVNIIFSVGGEGKCKLPLFVEQPKSQIAVMGETVTLVGTGRNVSGYQWRFNEVDLPDETNAVLTLANLTTNQGGRYSVYISGTNGSLVSSNALLTVIERGCSTVFSGLVGWWTGDNDTLDSAETNHGTIFGNVRYVSGVAGLGFEFDGSGDAVTIGNIPDFWLQDFTVEAWVKRNNVDLASHPANYGGFIFGYGIGGYGFGIQDDGHLYLAKVGNNLIPSEGQIVDTEFHHVALTKFGSRVEFYIDGVIDSTNTYTDTFSFNSAVSIGGAPNGGWSSFIGVVDEVAVYNRPLNQTEIFSIYAAESLGRCQTDLPRIMEHPLSRTIDAGEPVSLRVVARNAFSYQWRRNSTNIVGATSSSLTFLDPVIDDSGNYDVVIENMLGSVTSSNAILTVTSKPPCQPAPAGLAGWWKGDGNALDLAGNHHGTLMGDATYGMGRAGQGFSFDGTRGAVNVGFFPSLQLQDFTIEAWVKRNNTALASEPAGFGGFIYGHGWDGFCFGIQDDGHLYLGKVGRNLVTGDHRITDLNFHHVAVTKNGGNVVFYLDGVASGAVIYGDTFGFSTEGAIGGAPGGEWSTFIGIIDEVAIYNRPLSAAQVAAVYGARSSGKCKAPFVTVPPTNQTVFVGGTARFTTTPGGNAPFSYQWLFKGVPLSSGTNATLTLTNVQPDQAGAYSVTVSNVDGVATSPEAELTVVVMALPTILSPPQSQSVARGSDVNLSVVADGPAPLFYQWFFDDLPIEEATNAVLSLTKVQADATGTYSILVSNPVGSVTATATLTVQIPPTILSHPVDTVVPIHSNTTFQVLASGTPPLSYEWFFNGESLEGQGASSLQLDDVTPFRSGTYYAIVRNVAGAATSLVATLVVTVTPTDLDGNGVSDLILRNSHGALGTWLMDGTNVLQSHLLRSRVDPAWRLAAFVDFNRDGQTDFVWQHNNNQVAAWVIEGTVVRSSLLNAGKPASPGWNLVGGADFNRDGYSDLLWQHQDGYLAVWFMEEVNRKSAKFLRGGLKVNPIWQVKALTDVNADGQKDLIWQSDYGRVAAWIMDGTEASNVVLLQNEAASGWRMAGTADLNADNRSDLIWQHANGRCAVWFLDGTNRAGVAFLNDGEPAAAGWWIVGPR